VAWPPAGRPGPAGPARGAAGGAPWRGWAPADLRALTPPDELHARVLIFTVAATLVATVLFGLLPALHLGGSQATLRSARGASPANRRLRAALVAAEVAIASMLISTAVLLAQSFARM